MNFYRDKKTGEVFAYDDEQISTIDRINQPDFDREKEHIPDIFFEMDNDIKLMHKMTAKEIEAHINPPVTKEQQIADAEEKKLMLITEATSTIAPLQYAVDLGIAIPEEISALKEWMTYMVMLNRVDTSLGADVVWPTRPA